jgi:hypothetical protein
MAPSKDLPGPIVELITALARGRCIPGANRFARVCRQWREAGESSDELQPLLQLYIDKRWLDDADVARLSSWMSTHGHHVGALVYEADPDQRLPLDWFLGSAAALCNLVRLEVAQQDSLALLALVLDQLPQLQYLAAHVGLTKQRVGYGGKSFCHLGPPYTGPSAGSFLTGNKYWGNPAELGRLCPQLVHLHLTLDPDRCDVSVDFQLGYMLPKGLQQLTLVNAGAGQAGKDPVYACHVWLSPRYLQLGHHPALQQLVLHDVRLPEDELEYMLTGGSTTEECSEWEELGEGEEPEVYERPPLQLGVRLSDTLAGDKATLLQLAPLLTDLQVPSMADVQPLTHQALLTRLVLSGGPAGGTAHTLAALTGLRELDLGQCNGSDLAAAVEQVAGMPALRSLFVKGSTQDPAALSSSLGQCTQLTRLGLLSKVRSEDNYDSDSVEDSDYSEDSSDADDADQLPAQVNTGPLVLALQQLTGLRCLTVHPQLLQHEAGTWLGSLTALTRLCVQLPDYFSVQPRYPKAQPDRGVWGEVLDDTRPEGAWLGQRSEAEARSLLQQVQAWPASLQCVVFWIAPMSYKWRHTLICPKTWEHSIGGRAQGSIQVWLELPGEAAQGWPRPFQPCPHLQGVWELQAPGPGS